MARREGVGQGERSSDFSAAVSAANPERFTTQEIMPKILNQPQHAWINKPNDEIEKENAA